MRCKDSEWSDFQGAFNIYVQIDGISVEDNREDNLKNYCQLTAEAILKYMTQPSDFAVIISKVAMAKSSPMQIGPTITPGSNFELYFQTLPGHPVGTLLQNLLRSKKGCNFLTKVACILADAAEDEEYASYLYGYSPKRRSIQEQEQEQEQETEQI
jgi:hypothetical protein